MEIIKAYIPTIPIDTYQTNLMLHRLQLLLTAMENPVEQELQYTPMEGIAFHYHCFFICSLSYFHYASIDNKQYVIPMTADTWIIHSLHCVV